MERNILINSQSLEFYKLIYFSIISCFWAGVVAFDGILAVYVVDILNWPSKLMFVPAAVIHIGISLFEIPTGAYGDTRGRVKSTRLGFALLVLSLCLLGISATSEWLRFITPITFAILFSLGWTFYSGSLVAWIVAVHKKFGKEKQLSGFFASSGIIVNITLLLATGFYSLFVNKKIPLPLNICWFIAAIFILTALILTFLISDDVSQPEGKKSLLKHSKESLHYFYKNKRLFHLSFSTAALYGAYAVFFHGILLHASKFMGVSDPVDLLINILWPLTIGASILGSLFAKNFLNKKMKEGLLFVIGIGLFLCIGFYSYFSLYAVENGANFFLFIFTCFIIRFFYSSLMPWISEETHRLMAENIRSTVSSLISLKMELFAGFFGICFSLLLPEGFGSVHLWLFSSIALLLIFLFSSYKWCSFSNKLSKQKEICYETI